MHKWTRLHLRVHARVRRRAYAACTRTRARARIRAGHDRSRLISSYHVTCAYTVTRASLFGRNNAYYGSVPRIEMVKRF